ncbi:TPA: phage tail protein [Streptococcus suis]|nr:phage tail protein [Streptococcus suis]
MIYLKDGNIPLNLAYDDDIVQEANSTYQLSFKFPLTDGKWNLLKREVFLLADDLHGEQEFFIFEVKKVNGHVQVYAKQVATLLNYYSINSISVDRVPGQTVMTALAGSVKRPCPFSFFSDILDRHTFNESNVSVMDALTKDKHSIVGQWGGDLVRDKYQVKLLKNGGIENESLFMYKKNLSSYEESENINNLKTRLHLKKTIQGQSEGEADRVIAVTVDSPLIGQYRQIYEADIEVNDQDVTDVASLTAYGKRYFSSTLCDLVENSINLDVKGKSDVSVKMFDTVSVFHEQFDVDLRLKITSYHFGPMSKRLKSIGFGKVSQTFGSTVASMVAGSVDKATGRLSASFEQKLQKEIDNANRHFDAEFDKRVEGINDGIEQAQAEAERYADNIRQSINTEIAQVEQSMQAQSEEHDRQVADILSKTQSVESLANQAKADAVSALARALQAKADVIAEAKRLDTVERQATETKLATAKAQAVAEAGRLVDTAKSALDGRISAVDSNLTQTKEEIKLLATKQSVSDLTGRLSSAESSLILQADQIAQRVKTSDFNQATQRLNTAEASIVNLGNRITTEISETVAKIPREYGGRNYLRNSRKIIRSQQRFIEVLTWEVLAGLVGKTVTFSFDIKINPGGVSRPISVYRYQNNGISPALSSTVTPTSEWQRFSLSGIVKSDIVNSTYTKGGIGFYDWAGNNDYSIQLLKIELGTIATDWTPAPEDFDTELSSVKTTITQTASGVEQLSTSLTTTDSKVTTAEAKIRQLISDVSSKVSQTDYNTLTGRVDDAETAITQNATEISKRLTKTQVDKAITDKGYQTKSDVDSNITGRGYITSSTLQPYALSTTVQNLVQETATSFSRTISETKAMIPTEAGGRNYILGSRTVWINTNNLQTCPISTEQLKDGSREFIRIRRSNPLLNPSLISLYTEIRGFSSEMPTSGKGKISFKARASAPVNMNVMGILISSTSTNLPWDRSQIFIGTEWKTYSFDFEFVKGMTVLRANPLQILPPVPNLAEFYLDLCEWQLEAGSMTSSWSPAPEDLATVTALHSVRDTVDSHTRNISTINGTVSTLVQTAAGLVTEVSGTNGLKTQVSQLKNSWAVKISGPEGVKTAINASEDGVRLKGKNLWLDGNTLIDNAVITSAMIASLDAGKINTGELNAARIKAKSIDGSKIVFDQAFFNGLTANEAYLQQLFAKSAFITQVQAVTLSASKISGGILTATNRAMEVNLNAGQILYYTDQAALKRVLNGYPTQFVKFATGYVANKGQAGVTVIGSNRWNSESSNDGGFVGIRAWNGTDIDQIDVVGDTVRLASSAFEAADGWSINTLPGKLDIDAFNAAHRASSKIKVGDLWLWKNASTYSSMKETINLIIDNLQLLHSNKSTERAYSYTLPAKV